jgi:hypothetical protein
MGKLWRWDTQALVYENLLRRVGQAILPANDVSNTVADIIHGIREDIKGLTVRAEDNEILYILISLLYNAIDYVLETDKAFSTGHLQADGIRLTG